MIVCALLCGAFAKCNVKGTSMAVLVKAAADETSECYQILDEGREFQKAQGFTQWTDDYPTLQTVKDDIANGTGYVVKADGQIAAYMCIDFSGEPCYDNIEGAWHSSDAYAVVHRMAYSSKFRGIGLSDQVFALIEKFCLENDVHTIRVDTDFPNKRMQHILDKMGYKQCGTIIFQGSGKIAYDKLL